MKPARTLSVKALTASNPNTITNNDMTFKESRLYTILANFKNQSDCFKFAVIVTFIAFLIGIYLYTIPIAGKSLLFFISAPAATFFPSYLGWKRTFKSQKDYEFWELVGLSVFLTFVVHFLIFLILDVISVLGSLFTRSDVLSTLIGSLTYMAAIRMVVSLYYFGLLSVAIFVLVGLYIFMNAKNIKEV